MEVPQHNTHHSPSSRPRCYDDGVACMVCCVCDIHDSQVAVGDIDDSDETWGEGYLSVAEFSAWAGPVGADYIQVDYATTMGQQCEVDWCALIDDPF